jgi:protein-tyrosine phosphatase
MFRLFKKDTIPSIMETQLSVQTDMHSHVLPGIDDGAPDIATSLQLLHGMYDLGIRTVVATPHIIADLYRNDAVTINTALDKVKEAVAGAGLEMEISAAAEYMLDDYFVRLLRNGTPLLKIHDNIILTEQSYASPTDNLQEIAFEIMTNGYLPIMAHPERYFYYHTNYDAYDRLKDLGFLLQVNLLSLTGYYGKPVAKVAKYLFEEGMVDFVGTDMHHTKHLSTLKGNISLINQYIGGHSFNEFK